MATLVLGCGGGSEGEFDGPLHNVDVWIFATPQPGPGNRVVPLFERPFAGEFPLGNFFDHDLLIPVEDHNQGQLTWQGERHTVGLAVGVNSHSGYDWVMPEGTPLFAVADGEVLLAGSETPFFCAPLGRTTAGLAVVIVHVAPDGEEFASIYGHLSRVDVALGQPAHAGEPIGLSGNTGCSTAPHMHFGVSRRTNTNSGQPTLVDPYGWEETEADPWAAHPEGAESVWLWKEEQAPAVNCLFFTDVCSF